MGRGRKGAINQSAKKINKIGNAKTKHDNILWLGEKKPNPSQKRVVYLPEDVLKELRQMNPRAAANILINM